MRRLVLLVLVLAPAWSIGADSSSAGALDQLEEVLVIGEQPGPAMWRVHSGDRTLWLLGTVTLIPGGVTWHSKDLERVMADSQEVLLAGGLLGWGPKTRKERAALKNVSRLPSGQTLQDVVPPAMFAQIEEAQQTFAMRNGELERMNPFFASMSLVGESMKKLGLKPNGAGETVVGLARKLQIRLTRVPGLTEDFAQLLKNFETVDMTPCLEETLILLERQGAGVRALANAWAVGDVNELQRLVPKYSFDRVNPLEYQCRIAFQGNEQRVRDSIETHRRRWLAEAERALALNTSTLGLIPMGELLAPDGYIADLRARGYEVVEP